MPKPALTIEPAPELELTERQRLLLLNEFQNYELLKRDVEEAARDLALSKGVIEELRAELGVKSVRVGDYIVTDVSGGTTRTLNKKRLMAKHGLTPKQLADCYDERPKKGHTLITLPGDEEKAEAAKAAKKAAPRDERDDYEDRDE